MLIKFYYTDKKVNYNQLIVRMNAKFLVVAEVFQTACQHAVGCNNSMLESSSLGRLAVMYSVQYWATS